MPSAFNVRTIASRSLVVFSFVALPVAVTSYIVYLSLQPERMYDFHTFWNAGRDVLNGFDEYFIYPAPTAIAMVPFALLPYAVAAPIFLALMLATLPLTLAVLGVRDWRCYAIVFLYWPLLSSVANGAITTVLALAVAVLWRYRDRRGLAAAAAMAAIVSKIFLWPLWFWLLATRRFATALLVAGFGVASVVAGWAIIGFDEAADYPRLLVGLADQVQDDSYSPVALGLAAGLSTGQAYAGSVALGTAVLGAMFLVARDRPRERTTLVLAVTAALAFSPIVWLHYFALLIVPIALASPRLSMLWMVPLAYTLCGVDSGGSLGQILVAWAITGAIVFWSLRLLAGADRQRDAEAREPAGSALTPSLVGLRSHAL
jgi:hypothetical protein